MKVSIITPTYNSEKFIEKTIQSIINQTYTNWELLITDDNSNDQTVSIINNYVINDKRIKLYKLKNNSGAGIARNNSISKSSGRFISFCDSDDQWKPTKLEKQIKFLIDNKLKFTYSSYDIHNENGDFVKKVNALDILTYKILLRNNYVGCLTAIYDKDALGKMYMPALRKRQDWLLWIEILKIVGKTKGMKENLAIYCDRSNSISSNKFNMIKYNWIVYNKGLGFGVSKSIFLLINFLYYYAKKKI
jgi:glycosyltransferase involved in cell wall biosynthesis